MRILHVVRSGAFYGVERYIATLAAAQVAMGDQVVVIGGDEHAMPAAVAGTGVGFAPGGSPGQLASALRRWLPGTDLAHVHMTEAEFAVCAARPLLSPATTVVATRHFARHRGASRVGALLSPFIAATLDGQIAISRYVADRVEGDCRIIHPGVPTPAPHPSARRPVVLVAQRLEAEKSTDVAIRAFAASGLAAKGWTMEVAGSGALEPDLSALAARLCGTSVHLLGRRTDVPDLMATSSLLLASAPAEPFGLTVVEAMASGLPVVAARSGGHVESLPEQAVDHGFEPGDVDGAAAALRDLAADPALRERLALAGQDRHAALFTPRLQAERTRTFYDRVIADRA